MSNGRFKYDTTVTPCFEAKLLSTMTSFETSKTMKLVTFRNIRSRCRQNSGPAFGLIWLWSWSGWVWTWENCSAGKRPQGGETASEFSCARNGSLKCWESWKTWRELLELRRLLSQCRFRRCKDWKHLWLNWSRFESCLRIWTKISTSLSRQGSELVAASTCWSVPGKQKFRETT